ncbi:MAG: hypothetical protein RR420_01415 [Anaerovoracaceae bacterium]
MEANLVEVTKGDEFGQMNMTRIYDENKELLQSLSEECLLSVQCQLSEIMNCYTHYSDCEERIIEEYNFIVSYKETIPELTSILESINDEDFESIYEISSEILHDLIGNEVVVHDDEDSFYSHLDYITTELIENNLSSNCSMIEKILEVLYKNKLPIVVDARCGDRNLRRVVLFDSQQQLFGDFIKKSGLSDISGDTFYDFTEIPDWTYEHITLEAV